MAGAALLLSLATLLSRVLGLVREQVFAALLGAGFYGDAFAMAFRLPNLLRDLFAEGALSAAFQPAFQSAKKLDGQEAAQRLANLVLTFLIVVVGAIVVVGLILSPQMVGLWAQGFSSVAGKSELTTLLTRIMMPFLLLVSLAALAMGMLNAEQRFSAPALAPALFNVATVVTGLGLWLLGIGRSRTAAIAWAVATLCGGALQLLLQLVPLYRSGYRFALAFNVFDRRLHSVLFAMLPATIGLMATQVNIYISSSFASREDGAVVWLNVAFRLMQLPIGMFGVAVGTVALQRAADSASEVDLKVALDGVRETLRRGLRLVVFFSLPMAVAFYVLAEPILGVIYQHGAFAATDTLAAAVALRYYALGLLFYAAVKVVAPVFYALRLSRIPVLATVATVMVSVLLNLALHPRYGYRVLALSTSLGAAVNLIVLLVVFLRRYGGLLQPALILALCRMAVASAVMGLCLWALGPLLLGAAMGAAGHSGGAAAVPLWRALFGLALLCGLGGLAYGGLCWLMQVGEVGEALGALRRRLGR
jgi:putative peptidoglycan lipid II flippase